MAEAKEESRVTESDDAGRTIIADSVVSKIAGIATREIRGVHELGGTTERAISRITGAQKTTGVNVEVGDEEAIVDLHIIVDYGQSIPNMANEIRRNVMNQIQTLTGLRVKEVNISVNDLFFPEEQQAGGSESRVA